MANTYKLISSYTVGSGGISSIDFTSIPNTYTDLCLKFSLRDSRSSQGPGYLNLKFNDSTTGYSMKILFTSNDDGSVVTGSNSTDYLTYAINTNFSTVNTFGNGELYIPNYVGSAYKSISVDAVSETNHAYNAANRALSSFLWSNTAAITKITLYGGSMPFLQHSTAYLYGIKSS